jgi:basic amino acid/polyamine antiporter, APA family
VDYELKTPGSSNPDERVFIRQSTGLVRAVGVREALVYNCMITTIVLGAALTFLLAPYAYPHANLWLGVVIAGVFTAVMMVAYAILSSAMPRSGADYLFQTRLLHPIVAFALAVSYFLVWLPFWEALGGWLLAVVGVAPFASVIGTDQHIRWLTSFGTWAGQPWGITVISLVAFAVAFVVLLYGSRLFMRVQWVLWALLLTSFVVTWILLLSHGHSSFVATFDHYMSKVSGKHDYYSYVIASAHKAGLGNVSGYTLGATLGVAPVVWTALPWSYWIIANAGEMRGARKLSNMLGSMLGATGLNVLLIVITAILLVNSLGSQFLVSMGYLYYSGSSALASMPAAPFYGVITSLLSSSPIVIALLGLGFVATGIQILFGMAWGGSRTILSLAIDRMLPERLGDVDTRRGTPVKAIALFMLISIVWVYLYNHTVVSKYTLAVTLTSTLLYMGSMAAAIVFPYKAKELHSTSPAAKYKILGIPVVTVTGLIAFAFNALMVYYYLTNSRLGVNDGKSLAIVGGAIVLTVAYYLARRWWLRRQSFDPALVFSVIPPE